MTPVLREAAETIMKDGCCMKSILDGLKIAIWTLVNSHDIAKDENGEQKQNDETVRGEIHAKRTGGLRQASVRDFHSFRVTWVTLALTAGVPLELVQKVTGHKTTDVVLKHYFQPGREEFRRLIQTNMPALLTNGQQSPAQTPKEQALEILARTTARTWKTDCDKLKSLLEAM